MIWKDVKEFPDYQVSNTGLVRSFKQSKEGKLIKGGMMTSGYRYIRITINGKVLNRSVHRLVASSFIKNPNNHTDVNHINGDKLDNRIENLEWCNRSYNCRHSCVNGLRTNKLTIKEVREIKERLCNGEMGITIAKDYNINNRTVSNIKLGKSWGYVK